MDTNAQSNKQDNSNTFLEKLNDKKVNLLLNIPIFVVILFFVMFMVLPVAKIMYYNPKSVTLFKLSDYELSNTLPFMYGILIVMVSSIFSLGVALVKKNRIKSGTTVSIISGLITTVFTVLLSLCCEEIILSLQGVSGIRVDKGAAVTVMEIAGYLSAIFSISFGVIIALLKSGKIKFSIGN